jgi:hypothetical protein
MMVIEGRSCSISIVVRSAASGFTPLTAACRKGADDRAQGRRGMTLEEATASVLATCGATHRWEEGALVVGIRDSQLSP